MLSEKKTQIKLFRTTYQYISGGISSIFSQGMGVC